MLLVVSLPYLVDVANSTVVSFAWLFKGHALSDKEMSNWAFALFTAIIFVILYFSNTDLLIHCNGYPLSVAEQCLS